MPEIHLTQTVFTYNACGSFNKYKERIKKIKRTGDSRYLYQNELDKAYFLHHMVYGDFKDSLEEQPLIKYYMIKHLILLKIQNTMDINVGLLQ